MSDVRDVVAAWLDANAEWADEPESVADTFLAALANRDWVVMRRGELDPRVVEALRSEDEIAHGEAYHPQRRVGLGRCAYCDDMWPCRTQQGIDRLLARVHSRSEE